MSEKIKGARISKQNKRGEIASIIDEFRRLATRLKKEIREKKGGGLTVVEETRGGEKEIRREGRLGIKKKEGEGRGVEEERTSI